MVSSLVVDILCPRDRPSPPPSSFCLALPADGSQELPRDPGSRPGRLGQQASLARARGSSGTHPPAPRQPAACPGRPRGSRAYALETLAHRCTRTRVHTHLFSSPAAPLRSEVCPGDPGRRGDALSRLAPPTIAIISSVLVAPLPWEWGADFRRSGGAGHAVPFQVRTPHTHVCLVFGRKAMRWGRRAGRRQA